MSALIPNIFKQLSCVFGGLLPCFFLGIWTLLVPFVSTVDAQESSTKNSTITIDGLRFACRDCEVRPSGKCVIESGGERTLLDCREAIDELLQLRLARSDDLALPSNRELLGYLQQSTPDDHTAALLIRALLQSEEGQSLAQNNLVWWLSRYPDAIEGLVESRSLPSSLLLAIWKMPQAQIFEMSPSLRAKVAVTAAGVGPNDFFAELDDTQFQKALEKLHGMQSALRELPPALKSAPWEEAVADAVEVLSHCLRVDNSSQELPTCDQARVKALPPELQAFLERARVQWVMQRLEAGSLSAVARLQLYASTNYRDRRTPKVHQDVLTALIEIASAPPVESKKLLERPAAIEMLRYFAEFDDQIRYWVATMYLQLARAMLAAHDDGASITYLEQSYAMQMENVESRRNVLIALSQQAESNESDSGLHDRLRTLRVAEGLEISKTEERRVGIIRVITLILTLILIVVVARWILRKLRNYRSLKQEQQSRHQLLAEREELRELLIFFGLTAKSSLEDLAKRYRAKAKLIHPDRPDGDPVRFKQLTQRFERTRELMERYSLREK